MITQWVLDRAQDIITWVMGLWPTFTLPDWWGQLNSMLASVFANFQGMGVWVPWALIATVLAGTLGLWGTGALIKFVVWAYHLIPFNGGS